MATTPRRNAIALPDKEFDLSPMNDLFLTTGCTTRNISLYNELKGIEAFKSRITSLAGQSRGVYLRQIVWCLDLLW